MTFFGEVLPVVSRAVDEDECEEIIPQLIWKPSELLDADCKIEGDIDLLSIIITGKPVQDFVCDDLKLIGTFYEEFKLFSTDTLQTKEIGRVYLDENSSEKKKLVSCIFTKNSCPENSWDISSALLDLNKGQVLKVAVFESKPRALYQDEVNNKNELESVLKVLKTSNYKEKAVESGSVLLGSDLEQPNVVGGLSAAVLSNCELQNIPCKLYLCYSDVINSHSFENTLLQDELVSKVTKNIFTESPGFSQSSLYT